MEKDFDSWNKKKKGLQQVLFAHFVHVREVWWCSLGINLGFEQDGKNSLFERPVLILKKFNKDIVLIIPLTSSRRESMYNINFVHNGSEFSAIISQIRLISTKRLQRKMYKMDSGIFATIREAVKNML